MQDVRVANSIYAFISGKVFQAGNVKGLHNRSLWSPFATVSFDSGFRSYVRGVWPLLRPAAEMALARALHSASSGSPPLVPHTRFLSTDPGSLQKEA